MPEVRADERSVQGIIVVCSSLRRTKAFRKIAVEVELYLNLCLLGGVTDGQEGGTIGFLPADEVRFCPADVLIGLITAFQPAHSENTS